MYKRLLTKPRTGWGWVTVKSVISFGICLPLNVAFLISNASQLSNFEPLFITSIAFIRSIVKMIVLKQWFAMNEEHFISRSKTLLLFNSLRPDSCSENHFLKEWTDWPI